MQGSFKLFCNLSAISHSASHVNICFMNVFSLRCFPCLFSNFFRTESSTTKAAQLAKFMSTINVA